MKLEYPVKRIASVDDTAVTQQLPINVVQKLGPNVGSGFDLTHNRRDLEYENGLIQYTINGSTAVVTLDSD